MIGVPGTAQRLFGALREHGISVALISQGSSEHSICFALAQADADRAAAVVRAAFESELRQGQIQQVDVTRDCSILAVVGDGMAGTPGVAATLFNALGSSGVNVRAIAQGASERNISVVIDRDADGPRARLGPCQLLPLAAHDFHRPDRSGVGRQRLSRSAGVAGGSAHPRLQARSARARHPHFPEDGAGRLRGADWRSGADRWTLVARRICNVSWPTSTPAICRTR